MLGQSLVLMSSMQVLTLLFAFLVILGKTQPPLVASGVVSALVLFLMLLVYIDLGERHEKAFEMGFWLTFLSVTLLSAIALVLFRQTRTVSHPQLNVSEYCLGIL